MKKRILSLLLSITMCLGLLPGRVGAAYFGDVTSHWARSYIEDAVDMGLFNGTGPNRFEPEAAMTRAMFVTVLYRMDGAEAETSARYTDVRPGDWYADAVAWASDNGIVTGTSTYRFSPNENVTREQMVTILNRYLSAANAELVPEEEAASISFRDSASISPYARDAVQKMQRANIVNGKQDYRGGYRFDPQGKATRAEVACIMCRFLDALSYNWEEDEPDPEEAYEQMNEVTQSSELQNLSKRFQSASDSQKDSIVEQAIAYFEQQEEDGTIDYCDVDRENKVIQYTVDGIDAYYLLYDPDEITADASAVGSVSLSSDTIASGNMVGAAAATTVNSGKAIVLESYESSASSSAAKNFHYRSQFFKQCAEDNGLSVTVKKGVTLSDLKYGLYQYDVMYFNMHGMMHEDDPLICLEEKVTKEKYTNTYGSDVAAGNVGRYDALSFSGPKFLLRGRFFSKYYSNPHKLEAKWVHLGICYGMCGSQEIAEELTKAGAGCVTGYDGETWLLYDEYVYGGLFEYMQEDSKSLSDSFNPAVSRAREKTNDESLGNKRVRNYCRPNLLYYVKDGKSSYANVCFRKQTEPVIDTSAYIDIELEPNNGTVSGGTYSLYRVNSDGSEKLLFADKSFSLDHFTISKLEDAEYYRVLIKPTGYIQAETKVMAVQHPKATKVYVKELNITVIPPKNDTTDKPTTTPDKTTSTDLPDADSDGWTRVYNGEQLTKALDKNRNILLMADVKNVKGVNSYRGTLDGNGYTITNPIGLDGTHNTAWIDQLNSVGTIQNINFASIDFTFTQGFGTRAMIDKNNGTIDRCVIRSGKVKMELDKTGGYPYSGEIATFVGLNYGTIQNCVNMADVTAIQHSSPNIHASGIASSNLGKILNCLNLGSIYAESSVSDATASGITYSVYSGAVCSGSANAGKIEAVTFGEYCKSPARNIAYHDSVDYVYDCYATQRYDDDSFPEVISIVSRDTLLSMWSDVLN